MLLMPLRSDFGDINRVIGCTSGEGDLFAPPLAFAIEDVAVTPVEPEPSAEPKQAVPGFAERAGRVRRPPRRSSAHRRQPERPRRRDGERAAPGHRRQVARAGAGGAAVRTPRPPTLARPAE